MKKNQLLEKLFSLHRFGIKPGLERISLLLNEFGNPQNQYKKIHIAGTNGKGTVASTVASILQESGFKVGLYTSPHFLSFNERIKVNGVNIDDESVCKLIEKMFELAKDFTFFDFTTALAFIFFASQNVDYAVVEAGMGGRFDSTNIIIPELSVITQIDLDHREYLGNTIEEIAFEKAGIIKENIKCIIAEQKHNIHDIFKRVAAEKQSKLILIEERYFAKEIKFNMDLSTEFTALTPTNEYRIHSPLSGKHQIGNLITAIAAIENLSF